jgi:hypothetical protein
MTAKPWSMLSIQSQRYTTLAIVGCELVGFDGLHMLQRACLGRKVPRNRN